MSKNLCDTNTPGNESITLESPIKVTFEYADGTSKYLEGDDAFRWHNDSSILCS